MHYEMFYLNSMCDLQRPLAHRDPPTRAYDYIFMGGSIVAL